jgi:glycosyltransferase involved in cell wall biosynthesis
MASRKRILLWHGYLLSGSGSNIYTANLARVWRAQGHEVLLMCQERAAAQLPFVDAWGQFTPDNRSWNVRATPAAAASGSCIVVRPDIGEVLPVYVLDRYEGFTAKRFIDLSDAELEHYTAANVEALTTALGAFAPDGIVVGHEVMGPEIARRACAGTGDPYVAKLHGSALEYAVKLQARYLEHARTGLAGARVVTGGSRYMLDAASSVVPGWRHKAVVVNPGCDVELFRPPAERPRYRIARVGFVGKLIAAKGLHDLLGALGLTSQALRLEVVGYGGLEAELRELAGALQRGNRPRARELASRDRHMAHFVRFLSSDPSPAYWARAAEVEIRFHGRLEHEALAPLLPTFTVLVVPSVVPEAFGMVAAEAAACGVLPLCPRHSGIGETASVLEAELGAPGLLSYDPARPIEGIAQGLDRLVAIAPAERDELSRRVVDVARARWSWSEVGARLLELATAA